MPLYRPSLMGNPTVTKKILKESNDRRYQWRASILPTFGHAFLSVLFISWLGSLVVCRAATPTKINVFVAKKVIKAYNKTFNFYEQLVVNVNKEIAANKEEYADLSKARQNNFTKTLEKIAEASEDMAFLAIKSTKVAEKVVKTAQKVNARAKKIFEAASKQKAIAKNMKQGAEKLFKSVVQKQRDIDMVKAQQEKNLKETGRQESAAKCRKKRFAADMECAMKKSLQGKKAKLKDRVAKVQKALKHQLKLKKSAVKRKKSSAAVLVKYQKKFMKADQRYRNTTMVLKKLQVEQEQTKKAAEKIGILDKLLKKVGDGITTKLAVIKKPISAIVNSFKECNVAFMPFLPPKKNKGTGLPNLGTLDGFADKSSPAGAVTEKPEEDKDKEKI